MDPQLSTDALQQGVANGNMIILLAIVVLSLVTSFVCSILESAVLSVRIPTLIAGKESGHSGHALLLELKQNRIDDVISAILTLNTISNTIGASLAGAEAAIVFGNKWVGLFSAILTFLIFVFAEIIPKTLGNVYASQMAGVVGWASLVLTRIMSPILLLTGVLTRLIARNKKSRVTRGEISAMLVLAAKEGALSPEQLATFSSLLHSDKVTLDDIMTPRAVVAMLDGGLSVAQFLELDEDETFSRVPIYNENRDDVEGYVILREILSAVARGCDKHLPLRDFKRTVSFLPMQLPIGAAMRQLTSNHEHLALVVDEFGSLRGLVTMEDILETLLGIEIVDESDQEPDMRKLAMEIRQKRLNRLRDKQAGAKKLKEAARLNATASSVADASGRLKED